MVHRVVEGWVGTGYPSRSPSYSPVGDPMDPEQIAEATRLRETGLSFPKIAKAMIIWRFFHPRPPPKPREAESQEVEAAT